jgi:serine/threonine protein kinase
VGREGTLTDPLGIVSAALADRYTIVRVLGTGGMATVFLARDRRYDRDVAVKVLRPDLSATLGAERFLREIRITAQLNHPHILPLLDSGEAAGRHGGQAAGGPDATAEPLAAHLYYVMPYIAGGSLRHVLQQGTPIPTPEVIRLTRQVASALDHAHRHGVIHRDVKPENILLSEGEAVVADFGIARAVSAAADTSGGVLTRSGFPLGTPGYMSPEQATGTQRLDARTDVFGLACVVYEMLIGETPEMWPTDDAVRLGRFVDASDPHRERLDRLPGRLQQVLVRALAIRPADRFPSPGEFADALAAAAEHGPTLRDTDVDAVLRRAAELELTHPTQDPALSVGAVEQIAAEVGIEPEHVRRALQERVAPTTAPTPATAEKGVFDARKKTFQVDRVVDGDVSTDLFAQMVEDIQAVLAITGHASALGASLTWSPAAQGTEGRSVVVTVTARGGHTVIHIEERFTPTGLSAALPGIAGGVGAIFAVAVLGTAFGGVGADFLVPAALVGGGSAYWTLRGVITTMANTRGPELVALADRLAARAAGTPLPPLITSPRLPPGVTPA